MEYEMDEEDEAFLDVSSHTSTFTRKRENH